ncbi:glycosyltransferase [Desulfovibrio falkowii]|uniref:Glycosyl transferase group 1 n=1 Tax=Desulfovibrio desulfuricans (strain ATCC 27774 / DSM 6949 / MB) TaxID=525146 RepID=B8J3S5_DESDA
MNIIIDGHALGTLGGIERVVCDLASAMVRRGHQVTIFISEPLPARLMYPVDERVHFIVYTHNGRQGHLARFRQQVLSCSPDVCISPAADRRHLSWCAALWNSGVPLVISEHSTPEDVEGRIWNRAERLAVMTAADAIHMLRPSCLPSLPDSLRGKARVIPNAVNLPVLQRPPKDHPAIVSMGRLERDKQNHILIDAFAMLAQDFPQWHLDIWGVGPEQKRLEKQIQRLGVGNNAHIRGLTTKPEECYALADLLCQPSRHEAFPGAVVESMAARLPVVGFAQCPGVNELVRHGETGLLAPKMSAESLAETLRPLMQSAAIREKMGNKGGEAAIPYSPKIVYDAWEALLQDVILSQGKTNLQEAAFSSRIHDGQESQKMLRLLQHCMARPNVLVADGKLLRRLVFSSPWLTRRLRPFYDWLKGLCR